MNLTSYSANEIAEVLEGNHVLVHPNAQINNLLIDSRKGRRFETSLFIALDGELEWEKY